MINRNIMAAEPRVTRFKINWGDQPAAAAAGDNANQEEATVLQVRMTGVYKVPFNLIFFPTPIFLNLYFFPKISSPFFLTGYSSQQLQYYREDHIDFLFSTLYSSSQPWYSRLLCTTWYSTATDSINFNELYKPLKYDIKKNMPLSGLKSAKLSGGDEAQSAIQNCSDIFS